MKKITLAVSFLVLSSLILSNEAYAMTKTCGQISTSTHTHTFSKKSERNRLRLEKHNGKRLKTPSTAHQSQSLDSLRTLSLAPGYHEFLTVKGTHFALNVESNKKYLIAEQITIPKTLVPSKKYTVVITAVKDIKCQSSAIRPSLSQKQPHKKKDILPRELAFKINELTKELQAFYNVKGEKISVTLPRRIDGNFGMVVDSQNLKPNGILVLSISPNTSADFIGLKAQDIIFMINDVKLTEMHESMSIIQLFKDELSNISVGDELTLKIKRGNKNIDLSSDYSKIMLPEIKIEIN